ncbi:MAG TPA: copper-binding protein [Xanthobacteraceae bacterium]|nr:copper-binding protein [Xanthobacteraceae bacterium]
MHTKLLLWAFSAFAMVTSVYAADSKSETGDCKHPCPMMSEGSKMDGMHKGMGMGMGDDEKMDEMRKGMNMGGEKTVGSKYTAKGKVVAVKDSGITIAHGPVPALKWPAMSMEFALDSPTMAKDVKPGDTVSIQFVQRNGKYVVTHLAKAQ